MYMEVLNPVYLACIRRTLCMNLSASLLTENHTQLNLELYFLDLDGEKKKEEIGITYDEGWKI